MNETGYIFKFEHAAFSPDGKVAIADNDIADHNKQLADREWEAMLQSGRGLLYLTGDTVSTWDGSHKVQVYGSRKSFHNMAGRDGRTDVWFMLAGSRWHGVNIGDNQICRVKRCK
jgi:hypothetical protein